jgi:hypothetical protein
MSRDRIDLERLLLNVRNNIVRADYSVQVDGRRVQSRNHLRLHKALAEAHAILSKVQIKQEDEPK